MINMKLLSGNNTFSQHNQFIQQKRNTETYIFSYIPKAATFADEMQNRSCYISLESISCTFQTA